METKADLKLLRVDRIEPDPGQPRKVFQETALKELASSIKASGLTQPIIVRDNPDKDGFYIIIAGERRWRAVNLNEFESVECVVRDSSSLSDDDIADQQLTENLNREELNPIEKAEFIKARLLVLENAGQENPKKILAERLGVSLSWISKRLSVLKYSEDVRQLVMEGRIKDYELVKKVESLKGDKRKTALKQIKEGEFNSKEFFARKRYEKPKDDSQATENIDEKPEKKEPKKKNKISITSEIAYLIIRNTDYADVLDSESPEWKDNVLTFWPLFEQWLVETK
jgi:ParB family transcriptional regulator, chromosome partitioning protein